MAEGRWQSHEVAFIPDSATGNPQRQAWTLFPKEKDESLLYLKLCKMHVDRLGGGYSHDQKRPEE